MFWEDGAALIGLVLAATGLALSELTGNEMWDGISSVGIGVVLTIVALLLGLQARSLLLGAAASDETRAAIDACLANFPEVEAPLRVLTMQLGPHSVLVSGELRVRPELSLAQAEDLIARIDRALAETAPEVEDTFWELRA